MTDDELDDSIDELVDLGYLEPARTNAEGEVEYRLTSKATGPPRPRWGTGRRIAENDRIDLVLTSRERDLILYKAVASENFEPWNRVDAGRWNRSNDSYTVSLTLFELENIIEALVTAIRWDCHRPVRGELSRLAHRLSSINAEYDLIFRDDMSFRENW